MKKETNKLVIKGRLFGTTPGTWRTDNNGETISNGMFSICELSNTLHRKANARLIAAAPEILAALISTRAYMLKTGITYDNADQYNIINNAISLATNNQ